MTSFLAEGKASQRILNGVAIRPNPGTDFGAGLVNIGFSPRSPHALLFNSMTKLPAPKGMFFRNGSGALSLVYVAAGRLLGHVELHMHSWDCLGAIAIIEAAGGKVNDYRALEIGHPASLPSPSR